LSLPEVRSAVEEDIGKPVSRHSISWGLEKHANGPDALFARVSTGVYRVKSQDAG
jgi:hypothetical protein